jgi:predicted site-specific integrase-resolvase
LEAIMRNRPITLSEIRKWPPTCNIEEAARALGVSRSSLYMAVREGVAPVTVITVRRRQKVLTSSLVETLEGHRSAIA